MKQKKLWFDQRCDLQYGNGTFTMPYWYISIYADISKLQQWTNWNNVYLWQKHIHWLPKRYVISLFEISTLQQSGTLLQNHIHLYEKEELKRAKNGWHLIHWKKLCARNDKQCRNFGLKRSIYCIYVDTATPSLSILGWISTNHMHLICWIYNNQPRRSHSITWLWLS